MLHFNRPDSYFEAERTAINTLQEIALQVEEKLEGQYALLETWENTDRLDWLMGRVEVPALDALLTEMRATELFTQLLWDVKMTEELEEQEQRSKELAEGIQFRITE